MQAMTRAKGPGKFEGQWFIVEALYGTASDDDTGDVSEYGYAYSLYRGPFSLDTFPSEDRDRFNDADRERLLHNGGGFIIMEDSQGFVSGRWYQGTPGLESAWADIERRYAAWADVPEGGE